jgi:hypothetical protein
MQLDVVSLREEDEKQLIDAIPKGAKLAAVREVHRRVTTHGLLSNS